MQGTFFDFKGKKITQLSVNGHAIKKEDDGGT